MTLVEVLRVSLIAITFLSSLAFVITYHIVASWWDNDFGRSLMIYQTGMTIILGLSTLTAIFGRVTWIIIVGLLVFFMIPVTLVWRIITLIKMQRRGRKEDQNDS